MENKNSMSNNNKTGFIQSNKIIKEPNNKTGRKAITNKPQQYLETSKLKINVKNFKKENNGMTPYSVDLKASGLLSKSQLISSFDQNNTSDYQLLNENSIIQLDKSHISFTARNVWSKSKSKRKTNKETWNIKKINSNHQIRNICPLINRKSINENKLQDNSQTSLLNSSSLNTRRKRENNHFDSLSTHKKGLIQLIIKSNWGNTEVVGLKRIKLLDNLLKEIEIKRSVINGIIQQPSEVSNLVTVTNNNTTTTTTSTTNTNEDRWIYPFKHTKQIKLELQYNINQRLTSIEIVNYSGKDNSIGAKEIKIIKGSKVIWKGILAPTYREEKNTLPPKDTSLNIAFNSINKKQILQYEDIFKLKPRTKRDNTVSHQGNSNRKLMLNCSKENSLEKYTPINKSKTRKMNCGVIQNRFPNNIKEEDEEDSDYITSDKIRLSLLSNYGALKQIGLTGIELADEQGRIVSNQSIKELKAFPIIPSLSDQSENNNNSNNTIDNILNNKNETTKKKNMFLTYLPNDVKFKRTFIDISFLVSINIRRITIWNYNLINHLEKGTKEILISFFDNNKLIHIAHFLLFKAPGVEGIDYSQTFIYPFERVNHFNDSFSCTQLNTFAFNSYLSIPEYETPYLPSGFIFKLVLLSTWGDDNYIGFNDIELYDHKERKVIVNAIYSYPDKCRMQINTNEPLLFYLIKRANHLKRNCILFINYSPVCLSCAKIFNYSKYSEIGVKDFQLFCDNNIIYEGRCNMAKEKGDQIKNENNETVIVFKPKEEFFSIAINDSMTNSCKLLRQYQVIEKDDVKILRMNVD